MTRQSCVAASLWAVGMLVVACSGGGSGTPATGSSATTAPPTTAAAATLPEQVWVTTLAGDLLRLDAESGAVVTTVPLTEGDEVYANVAYGAGFVWATVYGSTEVVRVDVDSGESRRFDVGQTAWNLTAGESSVWVSSPDTTVLLRLDPATGAVVDRSDIGGTSARVVVGDGAAVAVLFSDESTELVRIDEHGTPGARQTFDYLYPTGAIVGDELWIGSLEGLDAVSLDTLQRNRIAVPQVGEVVAADGALWGDGFDEGLLRIDPVTATSEPWADPVDVRAVAAGGGHLYVVDEQGALHRGSTTEHGLAAFGDLPAAAFGLARVPPHLADGTPVEPAVTTTTVPPAGPVDVPAGVRWDVVTLPTDATASAAQHVWVTERGVVVFGREGAAAGRPVIWISSDGSTFTKADTAALNPSGRPMGLSSLAVSDLGFVAGGASYSSCLTPTDYTLLCARRDAIAWFSPDGVTWEEASAPDGSFAAGAVTQIQRILPFDGGFIATGVAQFSVSDWRIPVWTSADGRTWRQVALLREEHGLLGAPTMAAAGDRLLLTASLYVCDLPSEVPTGFGWGPPPPTTHRLFTSTDGTDWQAVDIVAAGLGTDEGALPCADAPESFGHGMVSGGRLLQIGSTAVWIELGASADTYLVSADGTTWTAIPQATVKEGEIAPRPDPTGDAVDEMLRLAPQLTTRGRMMIDVATFDGEAWTDWTEWSIGVPVTPLGPSPLAVDGIEAVASGTGLAVMVANAYDGQGTSHAVAYVSRPVTVSPSAVPACAPAPGADCAGVELVGADLSGRDLSGIDLRGARLENVDLRDADLSGAVLDDASLHRVQLAGANFTDASLHRVDAFLSPLDGADFTRADLRSAAIRESAVGTTFVDARMASVMVVGADLTGADLTGADLTGASFLGANLSGAHFGGANLTDVTWAGSTCPDGTVLPNEVTAECGSHLGT